MTLIKMTLGMLAVAAIAAGFLAMTPPDPWLSARVELVNRSAHAGPTVCAPDDGFGHGSHCDASHD